MRSLTVYFAVVALLLLLIPLPSLRVTSRTDKTDLDRPAQTLTPNKSSGTTTPTKGTTVSKAETSDVFRVQLESGIVEMTATDFLRYVVACEMPLSYGEEALKAQAVASYTYFSYQRDRARKAGKEADFSDVPQRFEETCSEEKLKARLGTYYEEYNRKLTDAVRAVQGYTVRYKGELILAAYHASNGGQTASAKEVWQTDYPYLQSVPSPLDSVATERVKEQTFFKEEVQAALETLDNVTLGENPTSWFGEATRFPCGLIDTVTIETSRQSGSAVRYALGLRSADFTVAFAEDTFTFTVIGYGHGVGLSQCGAGGMAQQGAIFEEILRHYYTDVTVEKA